MAADVAPERGQPGGLSRAIFDSSGRAGLRGGRRHRGYSQTFDAPVAGVYYVGISSDGDVSYDPKTSGSGSGRLDDRSLHADADTRLRPGYGKPVKRHAGYGPTDQREHHPYGNVCARHHRVLRLHRSGHRQSDRFGDAGGRTAFLPRLTLYGAAGQVLIQSDAVGSGNAWAELNQHLPPGIYYLAVSAGPGVSSARVTKVTCWIPSFPGALPLFQSLPVGE